MTYNGRDIEKPTVAMIDNYIQRKGYKLLAGKVYLFWNKRSWCKKDGTCLSSLEMAIDTYRKKFPTKKHKPLKIQKKKVKVKEKKKSLPTPKKKQKEKRPPIPYDEQMRDKRWYAFRKEVFKVKGKRCEKCGSTSNLQVHHPKYKSCRYAWEYEPSRMIVLCRRCHAKIHGIEVRE